MIPPGEELNPSSWSRHSLGTIVAGEVARMETSEGRAARSSEKENAQIGKIIGVAGGAVSGLDPMGKGLIGFALAKSSEYVLRRIPEPITVALVVISTNLGIGMAIVHAGDISAAVRREITVLIEVLSGIPNVSH